jgi:uncharacterized protein YcbX
VKSVRGESVRSLNLLLRGVEGDRLFAVVDDRGRPGTAKRSEALLGYSARTRDGAVEVLDAEGAAADVTLMAGAVDDSPVHVLTTASLAWLRRRLPDAAIDERRFRPNIVLDVPGESPVEQGWIGRVLSIGRAKLRMTRPTERCVMTTLAQGDLPADPRVLRCLGEEADACFGVYAQVVQPGEVRVGDSAS